MNNMEFDIRTLYLLRENTYLDPISYFKVQGLRQDAREYQAMINYLENCQIGVDYSKANKLEAELRFNEWKKVVKRYWNQNSGVTLDDFAIDLLKQRQGKEKQNVLKRMMRY